MSRWILYGLFIIAAALLLRGGIVALQEHYRTTIYFIDVGVIVVFGLPLLEIAATVATFFPLTPRIARIWIVLMPVLMINAAWRVIEYAQSTAPCLMKSGGDFEAFCNTVGFQVFVHVPFLAFGTVALLYHLYRVRRGKILS